ncbi:hypothetical protein Rumeso_03512 [Rubellimicrobium mesophilum DSM 19309]|uniref:histidine kinase n=1 Tax=Rubellimicrobium mesophilum DSM 19309 TaxID=442562 RepID=A0A017HKI7_9RHOB|nr:PAS domain S-box protein [Rubellimicrobium mesophilum]EYD74871.1 hypothetical protein Rumeso_03512 [Rubellimicrobium mesophilum DSM 19309]
MGAGSKDEEIARLHRENAELREALRRSRPAPAGSGDASDPILDPAVGHAVVVTDSEGRIGEWNEAARLLFGWDAHEALGADSRMMFTPEDRAIKAPEREMEVALAQGWAEVERWHLRKDGSLIWTTDLLMPLRGGRAAGFLRILRDRTEDPKAMYDQGRRTEQLRALVEAAQVIVAAPRLDDTVRAIAEAARRVVGAHQAACSLTRGPDRSQAIVAVDLSEKYARWRGHDALTDASGVHEWAAEGHRTLRMTQRELLAHPRLRGFGAETGRHPPMRGWLATPLVGSDGRNLGLIQLSDKEGGGDFDEADEALVAQLARFAASAVERALAEAHVREREEQLRLLADALPLLVSFIGRDQRYVVMNKAHEDWFEVPRSEMLGRTIREVLGEEAYAQRRDRIEAALRGEPMRFDAVTPATRGTRRDTQVHYLPRRDADGTVDGFYGVVLDLTEQKEAERALQAAREEAEREAARTGAILSQLAEGVIVTDEAGRIVFINEAARRIHGTAQLGVGPEDYTRRYRLFTVEGEPFPPEDLPLSRAALKGETVEDVRWIVRRSDGREVVAVGGARPVRTPDGHQVGAVLTMRDDTARAAAEAQLRRLNQDLETEVEARTAERDRIWQNSTELMGVFGFDGLRREVNPAWTRMLGWPEETLLSAPFTEIIHPGDRTRFLTAAARLRAGDRIVAFEARLRHADGTWRTVSWTAVPGDGVFHAIGRDVTEQRQAEEALRQSQKMEAVGQLTGGIAHDFNNLLAGIIGSLDLLQARLRQGRTGEVGRYVEAAMSSAQRAAALTHRLLAFSRRQPLDPKPVEANRLVAGVEDLLRRTLGPGIALGLTLEPGLWRTLCDPIQLESALLNLCINARDAMPDGGRLAIETTNVRLAGSDAASPREVAPGDYVAIVVSDTGIGMPPEVLARVFEPFFTTKPLGQGTGLGLSMVYGFARQSGGHVQVQSEEGRGTTVRLYLPRHAGGTEEGAGEAPPAEPPLAEAGQTVLVVEDEAVVRDLVVEVLGELGYEALEAPDGPAGLRLLQESRRIDLLITDVGLPGLDGRQLADQGRALRPGLRVLFVTGFAEGATISEGFLEPGMALLTKPFAVATLMAKIREALGRPG